MDCKREYEKWLSSQLITEDERAVLKAMTEEEIHEAFYTNTEFGTGGMRGIMGPGTNRINRYTVRMAAWSMAQVLLKEKEKPRAVVAYDTRRGSRIFAEETARVLAAAGVKAYLFEDYSPVPLLSFAIRHIEADGGAVITASHNTKEYNGFKVYDETGCQMLPEKTEIIAGYMRGIEDPFAIEIMDMDDAVIDRGMIVPLGESISDEFLKAVEGAGSYPEDREDAENLKVVYTPLHGSGRVYVARALANAGFSKLDILSSQAEFDGGFPTVKKPNPEDSKALEMAVKRALHTGADLVMGTDPDCDRVGIALVDSESGEVSYLSGNQVGALIIDYLSRVREDIEGKRLITTIVTGEMGPRIAEKKGLEVTKVLTGFKYIGEIMNTMEREGSAEDFFMGYEESYGYLTSDHCRDKDGVSTALLICRMAAFYKKEGKNLKAVLDELYNQYGYWEDSQESFQFEGSEGRKTMETIMATFRALKEEIFGNLKMRDENLEVSYEDYMRGVEELPKADVLRYTFRDGSWVAVRPSGTEPKIKIYYCVCGRDQEEAEKRRGWIEDCIHRLTDRF